MPELNTPEPDTDAELTSIQSEIESELAPVCLQSWNLDGATLTGKVRSENQDAFSIWQESPDRAFAVVCDGMGGHIGGSEASETAVEVMQSVIRELACSDIPPIDQLLFAIDEARSVFSKQKLEGMTTAILVMFEGDYIHYATLGDGALVAVFPDGMVTQIQTPHHVIGQPNNVVAAYIGNECDVAPRVGSLRIEAGTTIMSISDGASELFPYDDFAVDHSSYADYLISQKSPSLSQHLLKLIEEARDPETGTYLHHDNMTLVIAHMSTSVEETSNA